MIIKPSTLLKPQYNSVVFPPPPCAYSYDTLANAPHGAPASGVHRHRASSLRRSPPLDDLPFTTVSSPYTTNLPSNSQHSRTYNLATPSRSSPTEPVGIRSHITLPAPQFHPSATQNGNSYSIIIPLPLFHPSPQIMKLSYIPIPFTLLSSMR